MSKKKHLVRVLRSEQEEEEKRNLEIPLSGESQPHKVPTMANATTAASAEKTGGITTPLLSSSANADQGSVSEAGTNQTSGGRPGRIPTTSTAGFRGKSGAAGRVSAAAGGHAGSAAVGNLESADGGVECNATSSTDGAMRRKGSALGARGGGGAGIKKTAKASRSQLRTTAFAITSALVGTEDDIQEMVDTIKSRNLNNGGGRQAKGGPWTPEEDKALRGIVRRDGEGSWREKSEKLNEAMESHHKAMTTAAIAEGEALVEYGRAAAQCLHRWKKVLQPGLNKGHWTEKEDVLVRHEVAKAEAEGTILKWSEVARLLPGRLGKQCRERWFNHLDPSVKKTAWTPREDEILFNAQEFFSTRWCEISKFLPGRTENAVKNRYNSSAREKWAKSRPQAAGGAANKKAASRAFIDRLRSTLKKAPRVGRGCGGGASGPSNNKRTLDQKPPAPPSTPVGATPASLPSPSSNPKKRPKLALGAPSRNQNKLKQNHLGATLAGGVMKPFKIKRGASAASTKRSGGGGGGGGGAVPTDAKKPAASSRPSAPPAETTDGSGGKKPQQKQPSAQTTQKPKHRTGSAGSTLTTATSFSSDVPESGSVGGGTVRKSVSTARQKKNKTTAMIPRGSKAPSSRVIPANKRKKSTAQPEGKKRGPVTPEAAGTGARPPVQQAGVKRKSGRRTEDEFVAISAGRDLSVVEGGKGTGDRCRPTWIQLKRVLPGCSMSGCGRRDRRPENTAGPGAPSKAAHTEGVGGSERVSATWEQRALAAADAAAERVNAAARYMRGQWTLPQPEAPLAPPPSNSAPIAQPYRYLEIGPSDRKMYSPSSIASVAEAPSTTSASAASTRSASSSGSLSHVGTAPTASVFPRNTGTAAGARGAGAGVAVARTLVAHQTPSTLSTLSASGSTRKSNSGSKSSALLHAPVNTTNNNSNINSINSIITDNNSSSNHLSSAESFVSAFLADDVRASPLPFAPPEAWRMNSSVDLAQSLRTSSAASMMMMMMFGVGVGAGVSTRFDEEELPLPGGGNGRGGGAGDGRGLAATVAAATAAILRTQQAISSSRGGGGSSVGAGGRSGSPSPAPGAAVAAPPYTSRTTGEAAQAAQGLVGNPSLIEHGQHGKSPNQQAPVQIQEKMGGVPSGEHPVQRMAPSPVPCISLSPASSPATTSAAMIPSSTTSHSGTPSVASLALPATWGEAVGAPGSPAKPSGDIIGGGGCGGGLAGAASHGTVVPRDGAGGRDRDSDSDSNSGCGSGCGSGSGSGSGGGGGDVGIVHGTGLPLQEDKPIQRFLGAVVPSEAGAGSNGCDLRGLPGVSSPIPGPTTGSIAQDYTKNVARGTSGGGGGGGSSNSACDRVHETETDVVHAAKANQIAGGGSSAVGTNDEAGQHQQQFQTRSAIIGGE